MAAADSIVMGDLIRLGILMEKTGKSPVFLGNVKNLHAHGFTPLGRHRWRVEVKPHHTAIPKFFGTFQTYARRR